jgi:hypothetical protein
MLDPNYSDLLSAFLAHDVRFLIVGAYALGVHGRARATMDFDVWVEPTPENAGRVLAALREFGAPLQGVTEHDLSSPGIGLHIGVPPVRIDILTQISGVDFQRAWSGRTSAIFASRECPVIGVEDMLANKRAAGRAKDAADAEELEKIIAERSRR